MSNSTFTTGFPTSSGLEIALFGPFEARIDGERLPPFRTRRGEWLLALLVLRQGTGADRNWLAGTLWPESSEKQALYNLRRTLHDIRQALGSEAWRLGPAREGDGRTALCLDLSGSAAVDVLLFDAAVKRGLAMGDATALSLVVTLYRGPLFEGCAEPWALAERTQRESSYIAALEWLAMDRGRRGDRGGATDYLRQVLAREPDRESALCALLQSLADAGDYAAALREYRDFRLHLLDTLNATPSAETRALHDRLAAEAEMQKRGADIPAKQVPPPVISPGDEAISPTKFGPPGGVVPLESPDYIERSTDPRFFEALSRGDSIVLVKGPRMVGKTSLLARGLARVRRSGYRVAVTDLQKLTPRDLESAETLLLAFARQLATRLELDVTPEADWDSQSGPNESFERFLRRRILGASLPPLVWALDEVDQLFPYRFASEVFGLFRSWHNERALDPDGPWSRLTLAIAYATEAHLFITDLNQSPFNVGTHLALADFTQEEVAEMNRRYDRPLSDSASLNRYLQIVGGHPDLVRRGLQEIARSRAAGENDPLSALEASAAHDGGPFSNHLRRLQFALAQDTTLCDAVRQVLRGQACPGWNPFYRLRSAGVLLGDSPETARLRCGLYARYLEMHLP